MNNGNYLSRNIGIDLGVLTKFLARSRAMQTEGLSADVVSWSIRAILQAVLSESSGQV